MEFKELEDKFDSLKNQITNYAKELQFENNNIEETLIEKDKIIEKLTLENSELKLEINKLNLKIEKLENSLNNVNLNIDHDVSASVKEIFIQPQDVIIDYFENISFEKINLKDTLEIFENSLNIKISNLIHESCKEIINKFEELSKRDRSKFKSLFKNVFLKYIKYQISNKDFNGYNIFLLLKSLVENRLINNWSLDIKNYSSMIEDIFLHCSKDEEKVYNFYLLKIYYFYIGHSLAEKWFDKHLNNGFIESVKIISNEDLFNTLYLALWFKKDQEFIKQSHLIQSLLKTNIPEVVCYKSYYDCINEKIRSLEAESVISKERYNITYIDKNIKDIVVNNMIIKIKNKENSKKSSFIDKQEIQKTINKNVKLTLDTEEVILINDTYSKCPSCGSKLLCKDVDVAYYSVSIKKPKGYMNYSVLYCSECKITYVYEALLKIMKEEAKPCIIHYKNFTTNVFNKAKFKNDNNTNNHNINEKEPENFTRKVFWKVQRGIELTSFEEDWYLESKRATNITNCKLCANSCKDSTIKFCARYKSIEMEASKVRSKIGAIEAIKK